MLQRTIPVFFLLVGCLASAATGPVSGARADEPHPVTAYLFWQKGCPYCTSAKVELELLGKTHEALKFKSIELDNSSANEALYVAALNYFRYEQAAVPLVVIGD